MKNFRSLRSPSIPLTSFHDISVFLISSSIVLCHVLFGLSLLLYPWGFQSNVVFSIAPASLRNVCPIQLHFPLFIWISIGFCLVILHSSSFVILSVHFILIIRLKYLFINDVLYWYSILITYEVAFIVKKSALRKQNFSLTYLINFSCHSRSDKSDETRMNVMPVEDISNALLY